MEAKIEPKKEFFNNASAQREREGLSEEARASPRLATERKPSPKIDFAIGGQALIEGVMMRSPSFVTIAVRKKDGSIKTKDDPFRSLAQRYRLLKLPLVRGIINLFEMMAVGMNAVTFSAEEFANDMDEEPKRADSDTAPERGLSSTEPPPDPPQKKNRFIEIATIIFSIILSLGLAVFLFKFIPLFLTEQLREIFPAIAKNYLLFNLIDGGIRIGMFLLYVFTLSLFESFRRIFQYHGAEHMAIHTYEKGLQLTPENVKKFPPEHPRCGTSFLLAVFVVSIIIYSLVPRHPVFWTNLSLRILFLPLIAAVGYELLKWSAKHTDHPIVKMIVAPGLLTQKITTQKPDERQIEVAIEALELALLRERGRGIETDARTHRSGDRHGLDKDPLGADRLGRGDRAEERL